jgi:hypothetical protein
LIGKSNEIAGEVRDKVVAEMNAGMTILKSPKPDPRVIEIGFGLSQVPKAPPADVPLASIWSAFA